MPYAHDEDRLSFRSHFILVLDHLIGSKTKAEIPRSAFEGLYVQRVSMGFINQQLELGRDCFLDISAEPFEVLASTLFEFEYVQSTYRPSSLNT